MTQRHLVDPTIILHSPAARQWEQIGIKDHHGVILPIFSLHSQQSCGIGEYTDLIPMIDWCQSIGFDIIQILPVNDTGLNPSPYSAISASALHPIYLGLATLPYLDRFPEFQNSIKSLQSDSEKLRFDYSHVLKNKNRFLRNYWEKCRDLIKSSPEYSQFLERSPWLKGYAVFKTLKINHYWSCWESWPESLRDPTSLMIEHLADQYQDEVEMHSMIQFLCDRQLRLVKAHADIKQVYLMGDIPILVERDSADVWLHREIFDLSYSAGSPPDMYTPDGQNWGFPLYNWERLEKVDYNWWVDRLICASSYYHIYRIDHIVGFFRIWAIPLGAEGKEGVFIPNDQSLWVEHGRKILWIMLEKCTMLPIGEDLGIILPEVKTCLSMLGISGTRVIRWERKWQEDSRFIPFQEYPLDGMTTVSTHDSETLDQWWKDYPEEAKAFAQFKNWDYEPELGLEKHREVLEDSHHSNTLFHINLLQEYLALIPGLSWPNPEDNRINLPGTISPQNWTFRFRPSIEKIVTHDGLNSLMKSFTTPE